MQGVRSSARDGLKKPIKLKHFSKILQSLQKALRNSHAVHEQFASLPIVGCLASISRGRRPDFLVVMFRLQNVE